MIYIESLDHDGVLLFYDDLTTTLGFDTIDTAKTALKAIQQRFDGNSEITIKAFNSPDYILK